MRISIGVTDFSWPDGSMSAHLDEIVQAADESGIDTVWVSDHLIQATPGSRPDSEMLESLTTLGYLAARTNRVRLGAMVAAVTFREPAILIKAITTLDVLSGGRAWFGIGSGYQQEEAAAMGLPLPPTAERFERLEETLRLAHQMWSGDPSPFAGKHYQLDRPVNSPQSISRPHPPILIGGMGEKKTLPLVAKYADACNLFDIPDEGKTVRHKLSVLAEHCEKISRPYEQIEKTLSTRLDPATPYSKSYAEWGIDHLMVITSGQWTPEAVALLGAQAG